MDDGGSNGGGSFRVKHGSDATEVKDVHEAGAGEVGDVVGEKEAKIKSNTKIADRASEVKVVEDELLERYIEGSENFLTQFLDSVEYYLHIDLPHLSIQAIIIKKYLEDIY